MRKSFCLGTSVGCLDSFYLYKEIFNESYELSFLSDEHCVGDTLLSHKVGESFEYVSSGMTKGSHFFPVWLG